ncbi:hypothetical protein [Micromonospora sp. NPDC023633]|uniref:YncE family protein n=1 Tax=Micromonospora sp. NPDC023633 TaxID=3154320 RepID=UPI003408894C
MIAMAGALAVAGPASAAGITGDTATPLPLSSYADMQVNAAHNEVYLAGGDRIVVTDQNGTVLRIIDGQTRVSGLALSADGTRLYAALNGANAIAVHDLKKRRELKRYDTGAACPGDLALAVGKLWFSAGCSQNFGGSVSALDPTTGVITTHVTSLPTVQGVPLLAVSEREGWGTRLVVAARDLSMTQLKTYDITTGSPDPICWGPGPCAIDVPNIVQDMAVTADGANLVTADGAQYHTLRSVVGLSIERTYPSGAYPTAVGVATAGQLALGSDSPNADGTDLFGYEVTGDQPTWMYEFGVRETATNDLAPRGLAWGAADTRLYAVVTHHDGTSPVLRTLVPAL